MADTLPVGAAQPYGPPTDRNTGNLREDLMDRKVNVDPIDTINLPATNLWNMRFAKRIRQPSPSREETT
jgi:hypothetical protein